MKWLLSSSHRHGQFLPVAGRQLHRRHHYHLQGVQLFNLVARFGLPCLITSDRGAQFTSLLWATMSATLGIGLNTTTAFHPQTNGMVERLYHHLKEALKARLTAIDWHNQLQWVLSGLRTMVKADLDTSQADFVYSSPLSVPAGGLPATSLP